MTPYPWSRLRTDLRADIETYLDFAAEYAPDRRTAVKRLSALLTPSGLACAIYRLSHWAHARGARRLAMALAWCNLLLTRASIAPASRIGPGCYIPHPSTGIVFQGSAGRNLRLFAGCAVAAARTPLHGGELHEAPRLGDDVSVGAKALVTGPVVVGDGVRIGFNAVVDRDVASGARVFAPHVRLRGTRRAAQASF
jgi:serine O-acetyltransferase